MRKIISKVLGGLGITGAIISCFIYSDISLPLFEASGVKTKVSLPLTVFLVNLSNLFLLVSGLASIVLGFCISILDWMGLDFIASLILSSANHNSPESLVALFVTMVIPATALAGAGHYAAIAYAGQIGTWEAYTAIILGTIIRLSLIEATIKIIRIIGRSVKKLFIKK